VKYQWIILIIFMVLFVVPWLLMLYDKITGKHIMCDFLGWHNGKGKVGHFYDGASIHSSCSKCGKKVMQDSQGGWF